MSQLLSLAQHLRSATSFFAWFILLVSLSTCDASEFRTWQDASGKHSIDAKYKSAKGYVIFLERKDGSTVKIAKQKLSEEDRLYLKKYEELDENPFEETAPPKSKDNSSTTKSDKGNSTSGSASISPDWNGVKNVARYSGSPWRLNVPPVDAPKAPESLSPIAINELNVSIAVERSVAFDSTAGIAVMSASDRFAAVSRNPQYTQVTLLDLNAGKSVECGRIPGTKRVLAVHPDGKQFLFQKRDQRSGKSNLLEAWSISGDRLVSLFRWSPDDSRENAPFIPRMMKWAAFPEADRLLTLNDDGKLVLWSWPDVRPLYVFSIHAGCNPAVSPDRKFLAFSTVEGVGILHVRSGRISAGKKLSGLADNLSFSPDGQKIAFWLDGAIYVLNVSDGVAYRKIGIVNTNPFKDSILWPTSKGILIGGSRYFDLAEQVHVWDYQSSDEKPLYYKGACWFFSSQGRGSLSALVPFAIPHTAATIKLAEIKDDEDFFILKPGKTAKVEVVGEFDAEQRKKILKSLEDQVLSRGYKINPQSEITIEARYERGETIKRKYRHHGFRGLGGPLGPGGPQMVESEVSFQIINLSVKILYQEKAVWERSYTHGPPPILTVRDGESAQAAADRTREPDLSFFENSVLPAKLPRPQEGKFLFGAAPLGASAVTPHGLEKIEPPQLPPQKTIDPKKPTDPEQDRKPDEKPKYYL